MMKWIVRTVMAVLAAGVGLNMWLVHQDEPSSTTASSSAGAAQIEIAAASEPQPIPQVEQQMPEVAPEPPPAPSSPPPATNAAPAIVPAAATVQQAAGVNFQLLARTPNQWPKQVKLRYDMIFQPVINGRASGTLQLQAGTVVNVLRIRATEMDVQFLDASRTVPINYTDLEARMLATSTSMRIQ